ncbi:MAG TPA: UbiA-like polyprenyltransferase [Candidatus Limnocylindria bacterium]|nr:UbiA-like polyprenyltransferase [Candidatus Limnocylindria bacterium]
MVNPVGVLRLWGSFVKVSHTVFALPFALSAMLLAARPNHGWPGWRLFFLIVGAMVSARTCAMAFNRIVDRRFDGLNPRTAGRHLPSRQISLGSATALCVLSAVAFVAIAFGINPLCFYLSPVVLVVVCFYSLTKRFTDFTHVWLGVALALAPVGAWLAVTGRFEWLPQTNGHLNLQQSSLIPLVLAVAIVFWLVGFDIIYATQDYEFDRRQGLHSLVVRWGPGNALSVAFIAHLIMWIILALFGMLAQFRLVYWMALIVIGALLMMEHLLARRRDPASINVAFFKLNGVVSIVFLAAVAVEVTCPWFRLHLAPGTRLF